jgi:hypothetical protein
MKLRNGFVSNSSSTSFIITNKTNNDLTLVDFVKENPQLIEEFVDDYDWYKEDNGYNQDELIKSAENRDTLIKSGEQLMIFGDEDGDLIGHVFDYVLCDGGDSENFKWKFKEHLR